jgi:cell shape-determining protein MreC
MINTIYIYVIPIILLLTLLTLLDIAVKYRKFNSNKIKQIAEEHAEELEKYYQRIIALTEEEIKKFNNNLNNKLENYEELSNKLKRLEEQHKELLNIIDKQQQKIKKQSVDLTILIEKEARKTRANERLKNKIFNLDKKIKELEK